MQRHRGRESEGEEASRAGEQREEGLSWRAFSELWVLFRIPWEGSKGGRERSLNKDPVAVVWRADCRMGVEGATSAF